MQQASPKRIKAVLQDTSSLKLPTRHNVEDTASPLQWKHVQSLEEKGYCVVENAISEELRERLIADWLTTYESYGIGFKSDDPTTWGPGKRRPMGTRGMHDYPPVSQEHWVWDARLATAPIFSALWQTQPEGLLSSMDRVCFVPPTYLPQGKTWWHLDQARHTRRGTLECVQGMLVLEDIGEGDVALQVMQGAHAYHRRFFDEHMPADPERLGKCKNADWLKFVPGETEWYLKQPKVEVVRVHAKKCSLILWDSRLPHHAIPPVNLPRSGRTRFCIYVCMVPRSLSNAKRIQAQKQWFTTGRATSHWPQDAKPFAKVPRTYGAALREFPGFHLDAQLRKRDADVSDQALMKKLVGY